MFSATFFSMQIVNEYPPNYDRIKKVFPIEDRKDVVFTYGDNLHNPHEVEISTDLLIHEQTHARQQTDSESWWQKYLEDPEFRLQQELEAYAHQYKYIKDNLKAKLAKQFLEIIAGQLASPMYGNLLTLQEAESKIRNMAKTI